MTVLIDQFDREIGNVRLSLTDRCNLRCQYCMPEDGIKWLDNERLLTFDELARLMSIFYDHEIKKFRLTGGEPLLRKGIVEFIANFKQIYPDTEISVTTNGLRLSTLAKQLYEAGLDRINISLDTLNHQKFTEISRRDQFHKVISGIKSALQYDFVEIKLNAVSIKSFNDDIESLKAFIDFSEKYGIEVRFIEIMPFTGNNWEDGGFISSQELRNKISRIEEMVPLAMDNPASTSRTWSMRDGEAKIGFISSVTESFCDQCNRVRITADGKLRPCLHNGREYDLKSALREGKSDEVIIDIIKKGLNEKWEGHPDFLALKYKKPVNDREMIRIGG